MLGWVGGSEIQSKAEKIGDLRSTRRREVRAELNEKIIERSLSTSECANVIILSAKGLLIT